MREMKEPLEQNVLAESRNQRNLEEKKGSTTECTQGLTVVTDEVCVYGPANIKAGSTVDTTNEQPTVIDQVKEQSVTIDENVAVNNYVNEPVTDSVQEQQEPAMQKVEQSCEKIGHCLQKHAVTLLFNRWKKKCGGAVKKDKLKERSFYKIVDELLNNKLHKRFLIWYYRSQPTMGVRRRILGKAMNILHRHALVEQAKACFAYWRMKAIFSISNH